MDRNAESHFGHIETTNIKRSIFSEIFRNLSTCNAGDIIPFMAYSDILPGDTVKCQTSAVVRMQTPLNPTMDDAFVDIYYFAIPHRLVWTHWKQFMGENKDTAWTTQTEYEVPMFNAPTDGVATGTNLDYMGIPKGVENIQFSQLPMRALVLTYNTWFRKQAIIAPATEYNDDTIRTASNTTSELGGKPFKAAKIADYFTTCNPEPQKNLPGMDTPTIPLGESAPVITSDKVSSVANNIGMTWSDVTNNNWIKSESKANYTNLRIGDTVGNAQGATVATAANGTDVGYLNTLTPRNLVADLTQATAATINALRLYFQIQKLCELGARAGTRYFEILKSEFGTSPSMSALQYPEYLGGKRNPLNITQITQTSSTTGTDTELGGTGGMSHTTFTNDDFTKTFQEHTILLGLLVIRQYHTYQQGLHRMWTRKKKLDYYTPMLAHLGEQPVYKSELMCTGTETDKQVHGYQERWGEYKYGQQIITGEMNSKYAQSQDMWHYGDYYNDVPTLAQNWIEETPDYIDRTIAVKHTVSHQFKFDIVSNMIFTRPMPVYCTPGLIDHF